MNIDTEKKKLSHYVIHFLKFGFGSSFLEWIEIVLNDQEPCAANATTGTPLLKLQ